MALDVQNRDIPTSILVIVQPPSEEDGPLPDATSTVRDYGRHMFSEYARQTVLTPEYRRKRALRLTLPSNGYGVIRKETQPAVVNARRKVGLDGYVDVSGTFPCPLGEPPEVDETQDRLVREARNKLLEKIAQSPLSGGVMLAEANKTAQMITGAAKRMANSLKLLRKRQYLQALGTLTNGLKGRDVVRFTRKAGSKRAQARFEKAYDVDAVAAVRNTWLEWRYGWRLLLMDVEETATKAAETMSRAQQDRVTLIRVRTRKSGSKHTVLPTANSIEGMAFAGLQFVDYSITVRASAIYELESPLVRTLQQSGVINLADVAWNIIPFSFVLDWFLPVGDWLGSLSATAGLRFVTGSQSVKKIVQVNEVCNVSSDPQLAGLIQTGPARTASFMRTLLNPGGFSSPALSLSNGMVTSKGDPNIKRAADAVALLGAVMSSLGTRSSRY